jgi:hypothetical protein
MVFCGLPKDNPYGLTGSIKTKTFKRAQAVIHEHGVAAVAVIVRSPSVRAVSSSI